MPAEFLEQYRLPIQKIISADNEVIDAVILALREVPLTLQTITSAAGIAAKTQKINKKDAFDIILVVALLIALIEDRDISNDEAINMITEFVKNDESFLDANDQKIAQLRKWLINLLDNASILRRLYKASKVFEDYERIFSDVKVITDIRPLFDTSTNTRDESLYAVSVNHTIKISYRDLEGEKEFFVGLDSGALEYLHQEIGDALQKADSVKHMLKDAQITYISSETLPESESKESTD